MLIGIAAFVVVAVAAATAVFFVISRNSTQASEVEDGDCLAEIPDRSRVRYVNIVPCEQPHKGEVFAVLTIPDGDFPGEAAVVGYTDKCRPALAERSPARDIHDLSLQRSTANELPDTCFDVTKVAEDDFSRDGAVEHPFRITLKSLKYGVKPNAEVCDHVVMIPGNSMPRV